MREKTQSHAPFAGEGGKASNGGLGGALPPAPANVQPAAQPVQSAPVPPAAAPTPSAPAQEDFLIRDGVLEEYRGRAKHVVIPKGVRVIAPDAFVKRKGIEGVVIPDGAKEIAGHAFYQCESLARVRIPPSVEVINRQAFASKYDHRYPLTGRVALPALREVEMTPAQWKKYYYLFPHTPQAKRITQQKQWRERGLCQHCGGRIAFLTAQCRNCGKSKDY